jgi:hypothetical protein
VTKTRAAAVYTVLTIIVTWPQARNLAHGVTDFGDPLHFAWTLAWIAHAIVKSPGRLFDTNVLFPERYTLAYSETLVLPGVLFAPLLWLGADPILAQNLLVLLSYVACGLATFVLVRALTRDDAGALVAGAIFAIHPYRIEAYPKVPLQLIVWIPLALWALHRLFTKPGWRIAALTGALLGAQWYTSVTYAIYGAIFVAIVGVVLLIAAPASQRWLALRQCALAMGIAAVLAVPIALVYRTAQHVVGERSVQNVEVYSAQPPDYLHAHPDNALYGNAANPGEPERRLFPGYAAIALAALSLVPPFDVATVAYAVAGAGAFDLSLGVNGVGYRWLHEHVPALRGMRVPARFALLVGLAMSVLAGMAVARMTRRRSAVARWTIVTSLLVVVTLESRMKSVEYLSLPDQKPAVYAWLAAQSPAVICEWPVGQLQGRIGPQDETYMYYSTQHWQRMVNGDTGFMPASYFELIEHLRGFPNDESIRYLRQRGVTLLLVHSAFYITGDFSADVRMLKARQDLEWVGMFRWKSGDTTEVFRLR